MNNLELNQTPSLDPATEQLIRQVVSALLKPAEKGECRCHWLDPTKTPILAWKSAKDPDTLVLKIATQKFIGLTRSDKNNEMYWKFKDFYEAEKTVSVEVPNQPAQPVAPVKPQGESQPDQEPVNLPSPETESEQVKKFREKFGEFSASKQSSPDGERGSTAK